MSDQETADEEETDARHFRYQVGGRVHHALNTLHVHTSPDQLSRSKVQYHRSGGPFKPIQGNEIRLLEMVMPSSSASTTLLVSQDPHYRLVHSMLPKTSGQGTAIPEEFIALSYSWGNGFEHENIMLENCVYRVNPNLKRILQALNLNWLNHLFRNGCKVWTDSICINQTDIAEKSHQIKRMADIFKQATWVVVYDGESNIDRQRRSH